MNEEVRHDEARRRWQRNADEKGSRNGLLVKSVRVYQYFVSPMSRPV